MFTISNSLQRVDSLMSNVEQCQLSYLIEHGDMSLEEELKKSKQRQRKISEAVSKIRGTGVQFVLQELAMGMAFAKLSHDSRLRGSTESAERQKARAREAHETVRRFLPHATPNPSQKKKIEAGLAELDVKLSALGMPLSKPARSVKSASKNLELSISWELRRGISRANEGLRTSDVALRQELCGAELANRECRDSRKAHPAREPTEKA
jgi:hypothetical protein